MEIGSTVVFLDEFGRNVISTIVAENVMPKQNKDLFALAGTYGWYLRFKEEIRLATDEEKALFAGELKELEE